jgi:membrane protein
MAGPVAWVLEKIKKISNFIWSTPLTDLPRTKTFIVKESRISLLAFRGFARDKIQIRASSLTFYSLLSVVPIAAIAFAIAKGFGLDQNLEQLITDEFQSYPEILSWLLENARNALQETRGGYIAGVGVIVLFWSVMSLLEEIENTFNHIWQIKTPRTWYRKFTDYLTIMLIAPIFIILSSSFTVFVSTELSDFMMKAKILEFFKPFVEFLFRFTPFFLTWVSFTLLFIVMPNTKVKFLPAMISAIITGTFFIILQWLYIDLQFGIARLSAIYGSFAAIPLFILWLQASWFVVLFGAELAFTRQHTLRYGFESEALQVSTFQKRALILMIMNVIVKKFELGERPLSVEDISNDLRIPIRLVRVLLKDLHDAGLISEIHDPDETERFQPALDINQITVSFIFSRLDKKGIDERMVIRNREFDHVVNILEDFDTIIYTSDSNILVKDI